jgi:dipeptidyl aminopeptidase/acylaminoacyl peptidase
VTADGRDLVWYSNRSGFGHLYLYDAATGALRNQITTGAWDVADLVRVDEAGRQIYFAAGGLGSDPNPYHAKLYRIGFDGGDMVELTPEDTNHLFGGLRFGVVSLARSQISPSGRSFVDVHTTLDQPPIMLLRRIDGSLIGEVARADASDLYATGWTPPERFVVKAADGETDLWGVYYKPMDFDPARKYAVIDHMYPGPQAAFGPHAFLTGTHIATDSQALANLGFIVINVDGRGSTYRGATFRYAFAGTEDVFGAADHKAAIENLAAAHDFVDASRVGVKGASYGGYGSTRATLLFPDFFNVNVSYVGPHDFTNISSPISNERFFWNSDDREEIKAFYALTSNTRLASQLKGKMFLIWGEIDENVPANNAYIMKQALLDADVDFDSLIVPNNPHAVSHPSVHRREFKYFHDHLGPPR